MPKNFAASRPVNPPGASPKITAAQLWKGLELKIKQPEIFLPAATGAEFAASATGEKSIRTMTTKDGRVIKEAVKAYEGTITYFDSVDSNFRITNLISFDQNNDLLLTFSFAGGLPPVPNMNENTPAEELNKAVGAVIEKTIEVIREKVKSGKF